MRRVSSALAGLVILGLVSGCKTYVDSMGGDDAAVDDDGAGDDDTGGDDDAADDDSDGVDADGDGYTEAQGDCDDGDPTAYPGAPDLCDGIVNDCDAVLQPHTEDGIVHFAGADGHIAVLTDLFAETGPDDIVEYDLDTNGVLTFCEGTYYTRLTVTAADVTIAGLSDGPQPATLHAAWSGTVVRHAHHGGSLRLERLRIEGGSASEGGGVHSTEGTVVLDSCDVRNSHAVLRGAGVYLGAGDLRIEGCSFSDNATLEVFGGGGGVYLGEGSLEVAGASFTDNLASDGAALYVWGDLAVTDGRFESNRATVADGGLGGAIMAASGDVTIRESRFEHNEATLGGAIWAYDADLLVEDSVVLFNAAETGGALYLDGTPLTCVGQAGEILGFFANTATGWGGAVYSNGSVTSDLCDWGSMADSNLPQDLVIADAVFADYDDDASFYCDAQGCGP